MIESLLVMAETINVEKSMRVKAIKATRNFFKESPLEFNLIYPHIINFYYKELLADISRSSIKENNFFSYISTATRPIIAALSEQYFSSLRISSAL